MENSKNNFDDLVFETRNKEYGAYFLRKSYSKNMLMSLLIGIFIFGTILASPYIFNNVNKVEKKTIKVREIVLDNPPSLDEKKEIPEVKIKYEEPEKIKSVEFVVPIITTEEITNTTTTEDLLASNPGLITQNGIDGLIGLPGDNEEEGEIIGEVKKDKVFTIVEKMPRFPGGDEEMFKFLDKNIVYPSNAKDLNVQGKVYVSFVIDTFGNISNVSVERGIGFGCDDEAIRVISMMPRWEPGLQSGHPVKVKFVLPIYFKLK